MVVQRSGILIQNKANDNGHVLDTVDSFREGLDEFSRLDAILAPMQSEDARVAMAAAFDAGSEELGQAAVRVARARGQNR